LAAILSPHGLYGGNRKSKIPFPNNEGYKPLKGGFGSLQAFSIGRMPGDRNLLSLYASFATPTRVLRFEDSGLRRRTPVRPVRPTGQTGLALLQHRLRFSGLGFVDQPRNPMVSGEPPETPRTRCSLRQSPLMTRLPRSPCSTLVFRLNQETVHDFILQFMPPCGPHLNPLATGSLERSLLFFSTPGGLTGDDLSRFFFTCTNTCQAATCTCNT
jgi:hypothetical protein